MRIAKNIRTHVYKGITTFELVEKSPEEWNKAAAVKRQALFLRLYGFDPMDAKEAQEGLNKYFKGE